MPEGEIEALRHRILELAHELGAMGSPPVIGDNEGFAEYNDRLEEFNVWKTRGRKELDRAVAKLVELEARTQ
jgi:hypothetical protein